MSNDHFVKGDYNAICDFCGQKFKASKLRKNWQGFMVCERDWELRHPQDAVRAKKDDQSVPWTRPESADVETDISGWQAPTGVIPTGTFDNEI